MDTRPPSLGHRLYFWFTLATLSTVLPEVVTFNDPVPWDSALGWYLGYPVYGLHVLVLGGFMFRHRLAGYATLLAYGGLFGLFEGYLIKQLWNPNWGVELTANVGGVRLFHTTMLVFFVHPILAFVLPLLLAERLLLRPGRLTERLPARIQGFRGTATMLVLLGVYLGVVLGGNLPGQAAIRQPLVSTVVLTGLGLVWRVGLWGHRYRLEELLPTGRWLSGFAGVLFVLYPVYTVTIRPDALPERLLPHAIVWGLYLLFAATIVLTTWGTTPVSVPPRAGLTRRQVVALTGLFLGVLFVVALVQAPTTQPGMTLTVLSFVGLGVVNCCLLVAVVGRGVVSRIVGTM
ncbi:hypothetical protein [Haloarchaeobius sp. DFWS5]|uniref:hypothetical protein n=1 Tax=Haloarchaeobius sp. DFWS5 TaxID=3446114 RepID=UPI003EBB855C